jgi:hypothetical protein
VSARWAVALALGLAVRAFASEGEAGVYGLGDSFEVGAVAGPWSSQWSGAVPNNVPPSTQATLLGARLNFGAYTHRTLLGQPGGVEADASFGYALATPQGFFWGQLDALANIGLLNLAVDRFVARLHLLVGFGFSLFSGTSMEGGARVALGANEWCSLEASYLALPTTSLTLSHRVQANLTVVPIHVALGAQLDFGASAVGQSHFALMGTLTFRPKFD